MSTYMRPTLVLNLKAAARPYGRVPSLLPQPGDFERGTLSPARAILPEPPSLNRPVFGEDPEQLRTGVPTVSQRHRVDESVEDDPDGELPDNRPRTEAIEGGEADQATGQQEADP